MILKNINDLIDSLKKSMGSKFNQEQAEAFARYCIGLKIKKKRGEFANPWMESVTVERLDFLFRKVAEEGLVFDGDRITLNKRGLSYDYRAYKAKMLIAYPKSLIDLQLVYEGDDYSFRKDNGQITYSHKISNPFDQKYSDIIGGYFIVINQRGQFLTTLSKADIEKHRKIAMNDDVWGLWYKEMCLKTVIRKGCKFHFDDIFSKMNDMDNVNYDLNKVKAIQKSQEKFPSEKQWRSFQERFKRGEAGILEQMEEHYDLTDKEWIVNNRPEPTPEQWAALQKSFEQGDTDLEAIERSYKLSKEQLKWIKEKS